MAATSLGGPGTTVTLGTYDGYIDSISIDGETVDQIDTSHMGSSSNARTFISGLIDGGTITITSHYDPDCVDPPVPGDDDVSLTIDAQGTKGISATVNVAGRSANIDKDGKYTVTHTLKVTGVLDLHATLA